MNTLKLLVGLFLRFFYQTPPEPIKPPTPPPMPEPVPLVETAAERLAEAAIAMLGTDVTPDDKVPDEVACVSSLVAVVPAEFGLSKKLTYTPLLVNALDNNDHFERVSVPRKGTIVVSPTQGTNVGHCGIYVEDNQIASNNSKTGKWEVNYTRQSWIAYFGNKKQLRGYLFAPVDTV